MKARPSCWRAPSCRGSSAGSTRRAMPRPSASGASASSVHFTRPRWNEELVLQRYELLYEAGLVPEAGRPRRPVADPVPGEPMRYDHRRILATGIARLRAKIKYRPVVFELMPPDFTLGQLQRAVEALAGRPLAQAEFPPPGRAAGPRRGDRRHVGRHRRPSGQALPLPPRDPARTRRRRHQAAARPLCLTTRSIQVTERPLDAALCSGLA